LGPLHAFLLFEERKDKKKKKIVPTVDKSQEENYKKEAVRYKYGNSLLSLNECIEPKSLEERKRR